MARNRYYQGLPSDHFDGVRFFNPGQPSTDRGLVDILRWKLAGSAAEWPAHVSINAVLPDARVAGLRVTMVGHATLLVQAAGVNILTDPVWSRRASPFSFVGPKRVTEPGIAFADLPPIDAVLLSHCHYDHLDLKTLKRIHDVHAPVMAVPLGNETIIRRHIPDARCVVGDWWDELDLGKGVTTALTPAIHWSNRWPTDVRMALWAGHHVSTPAGTLWFAGDSAYGDGSVFGRIRERLGAPDVAILPIGAYEPRWFMAVQHMNPAEAARAFLDVGATEALGIHWGTFQLTDEAREAPRLALASALSALGIAPRRFTTAQVGHAYDLGNKN